MSFTLMLSLLLVAVAERETPGDRPSPLSRRIDVFKLQDHHGNWHDLADVARSKLVVVTFLAADCPLSGRYAPRLAALADEFGPRGVIFFAIDANEHDSVSDLGRLAKNCQLRFPLLKDLGSVVADRFGARRNPEAFVLDGNRVVRYCGRIDDQYGLDYARPRPGRRDLALALEDLLAGRPVSVSETEAPGCLIDRPSRQPATGNITYTKHVAPVLQRHCVSCHRKGGLAPFTLASYQDATGWAQNIREVIANGRMPPWHADPKYGTFANDTRLAEAEKKLVTSWVRHGMPEGDPRHLPPAPTFAEGWRIPQPDVVLTMRSPIDIPAEGSMPYRYVRIDPGFKEGKWVRACEARPGNRAVVHHLVVFVEPPGTLPIFGLLNTPTDLLGGGGPATPPLVCPEGYAKFVPAGSKLVLQIHYTPNGTAQTDQSCIGLVFADPATVKKEIHSGLAARIDFRIPPGVANYPITAGHRFPQDYVLFSLVPHMHLRGKSFRFEAFYPGGKREVLLDVPRYSFDWQNAYVFTEPKRMPEGTVLKCYAVYDNSERNPSNPDPRATVHFGEQTSDEMMVGFFTMALADQDLTQGGPRIKPLRDGRREISFSYIPPPGASTVYLAGTFNEWKPTAHKMDGPDAKGKFTTRLELKRGRYEYKFVIDGKNWRADPGNRRQAGFYNNSVLEMPPSPG